MELSVVIPVYNSERTIGPLVARLQTALQPLSFEVVLVNDGSRDGSEAVCLALEDRFDNVRFFSLRRNFGEFNAVLCGLNQTEGEYVVIIDDDFQNPPEAIVTLLKTAETGRYDVVYSRYAEKKHNWFRNLGSRLVNTLTTYSLNKPSGLYLSSFKLIHRDVVAEIRKYQGPYPYIDGLIFRVTRNVGSVEVPHDPRREGQSNYTLRKLVSLFLNILIGYSLWPLRVFTVLGLGLFGLGLLLGFGLLAVSIATDYRVAGWQIVIWAVLTLAGLQCLFIGVLGEYVGKLFMAHSGLPPYVLKRGGGRKGRREERVEP
ncbi:glycosyltransferase [Fibrisoma montanum]|uniref:Glycosyltransferase n=1 Tax=Fibrisoma montanum TaxID=2305895 RepID=A0A418M0A0_9BACT|nr:glycosyltransferase family 2 protein [Fibrisoma montanum]RIV19006.1 glycosyltransferase [Fibrisoma montanum]